MVANLCLQILFVINQPDVYRSPSSNTWMYVFECHRLLLS